MSIIYNVIKFLTVPIVSFFSTNCKTLHSHPTSYMMWYKNFMENRMFKDKKKLTTAILTLFASFVFIQSLFFKFSGAPETQYIFNTLNDWASNSIGIEGLFVPPGIFNAYIIGSAELVASILLLLGAFTKYKKFTPLGALLGLGVMTGAIFFHLFTPLGTEVQGDGGTLFTMACLVWVSCLVLLKLNKHLLPLKR